VTIDPHRMGRASAAALLAWLSREAPADRLRVQAAALVALATTGAVHTG
jgi:hypothetical protein